jgi:HSP20 family molecular chaperone IbpA
MALFPRFYSSVESDFAPMFRLMDDYANHVLSSPARRTNGSLSGPSSISSNLRNFQPKFDVKETEQAYELYGELPGVEQKNLEIEFTDPQTLRVSGSTKYVREEGERPAGLLENGEQQGKIEAYEKPTAEEETMSGANPDAKGEIVKEEGKEEQPKGRYWISERATGSFSRQFAFPTPVDQDAVKASMKNGILSVTVPKAQAPTKKRITIE